MLCSVIINLLNKGTICLTQKWNHVFTSCDEDEYHMCVTEKKLLVRNESPHLFSRCQSSSLVFHSFSVTPYLNTPLRCHVGECRDR